jgi:hypothetical protein
MEEVDVIGELNWIVKDLQAKCQWNLNSHPRAATAYREAVSALVPLIDRLRLGGYEHAEAPSVDEWGKAKRKLAEVVRLRNHAVVIAAQEFGVGNDLNARVHKRFGERLTNILHGRTWEGGTYPEAEETPELPQEEGSVVVAEAKVCGAGVKYEFIRQADGKWRGQVHLIDNDDELRRAFNVISTSGPIKLPQERGAVIIAQRKGRAARDEFARLSNGQWVGVSLTYATDAELLHAYHVARVL